MRRRHPRFTCKWVAVALTVVGLLSACVAPLQNGAAAAEAPSPLKIESGASPEQRGREVLRIVLALARHGNLRDTGFTSRLLGAPIPAEAMVLLTGDNVLSGLVHGFLHEFPAVGPWNEIVRFRMQPVTLQRSLRDVHRKLAVVREYERRRTVDEVTRRDRQASHDMVCDGRNAVSAVRLRGITSGAGGGRRGKRESARR